MDESRFDIIIINSVIQAFRFSIPPQRDEAGHRFAGDSGYLFIGDIMDPDRKDELIRELVSFKYAAENKDKNYKTKTDFSAELFVPRGFWEDLGAEWPEIRDIRCSAKIYTIANELTRFRYDAMITVHKQCPASNVRKWQKRKYQDDLRSLTSLATDGIVGKAAQSPPASLISCIHRVPPGNPKGSW